MELSVFGILFLIVLSGVCGLVAHAVVRFDREGLVAAITLGLSGALAGLILAEAAGVPSWLVLDLGGMTVRLVWAAAGAALLVALAAFAVGRRRRRPRQMTSL